MAWIIGILAVLFTFLGGFFAIRFKDKLHLILGFSAGAVIGVAFFDLIPESFALSGTNFNTEITSGFIAIGFILYMILDRFFSLHGHCDDHDEHCENPSHNGHLGATALVFHSFLDGLGVGLAFKVSPAVGWIVAAAVLAHDFSDGINTINMVLKDRGKLKEAYKWLVLDAIAPAAGIVATFFFTIKESALGLILAVFAGFFLYIGACDLVPESHHRHPAIWTTLMTILGIIVIFTAIHFAG